MSRASIIEMSRKYNGLVDEPIDIVPIMPETYNAADPWEAFLSAGMPEERLVILGQEGAKSVRAQAIAAIERSRAVRAGKGEKVA